MKKEKVYSLCEAVADITYIAAKENYQTDDSREIIIQFIQWAKEFEHLPKHSNLAAILRLHQFNLLFYIHHNQ